MVHGGAAPPGGQEEAAASGEDACGDKRAQPEQREAEDEAPATRPCLQLENGARGGAESMACRVARQRARRLLPARHRENCVSTPLRSATHASTVLRGVEEMYRENTLCDVTMRVDDEDFPAHRIVLAAASDFLRSASERETLHFNNAPPLARAQMLRPRQCCRTCTRLRRRTCTRSAACKLAAIRARTRSCGLNCAACAGPC